MGRPVAAGERLDAVVSAALTPEQKDQFRQAVRARGGESMSVALRRIVLEYIAQAPIEEPATEEATDAGA